MPLKAVDKIQHREIILGEARRLINLLRRSLQKTGEVLLQKRSQILHLPGQVNHSDDFPVDGFCTQAVQILPCFQFLLHFDF